MESVQSWAAGATPATACMTAAFPSVSILGTSRLYSFFFINYVYHFLAGVSNIGLVRKRLLLCLSHEVYWSEQKAICLPTGQLIELTDLENSGLCDIRAFDCRSIRIFGIGFIDSAELSCHTTRLKVRKERSNLRPRAFKTSVFIIIIISQQYMNKVWVPAENQRTKATFLSSKVLDCALPSLNNIILDTQDFMMNDQPYARWEIKARLILLLPCNL